MAPRFVAIIQARMGSSRLPGKVMLKLGANTVLEHVVGRVRDSRAFDEVIVATTTAPADNVLASHAASCGASVFRGSELDVLGRFYEAAEGARADVIARITADCPLIDPACLASMVDAYKRESKAVAAVAMVTNARKRTFPRGLDAEIFSRESLLTAHTEGLEGYHREHVTPYIYEHPERFRIFDYIAEQDRSDLRLTLDTPEDLALLRKIFDSTRSETGRNFGIAEVVQLLDGNVDWLDINSAVRQKTQRE